MLLAPRDLNPALNRSSYVIGLSSGFAIVKIKNNFLLDINYSKIKKTSLLGCPTWT